MTHVPSNKIPIRDSGSRVSKIGVNLYEIVGIRLDDTSKQGLMHEYVGKHAKMQRSKKSQTSGTKQERQALHHRMEWRKVCIKHTNIMEICLTSSHIQISHKSDKCNHTSKWPQRPISTIPQRAKSMAKPRSRQVNMDIKYIRKQAYTCIKELIQTL